MSINTLLLSLFCLSWAGVAAQSLGMILILFWLALFFWRASASRDWMRIPLAPGLARSSLFLGLAWLLWAVFASRSNPATASAPPSYLGGYLWWAVAPWTISVIANTWAVQPAALRERFNAQALRILCWVGTILSLIAISQFVWGWKIHGTTFVESEPRARALFSHPLTLAYIVLLYVPLALAMFMRHPRSKPWLLAVISLGVLLIASASRTVQAVVFLMLLLWSIFFLRGRLRAVLLLAAMAFVAVMSLTDNPVRQRFLNTASQTEDRQQDLYADDRLAFWAAHWEMVKERPLIGHGLSYKQDYLTRYYAVKGLGNFEKKYQAHNMYLQLLVNTGVTGLLFWLGRLAVTVSAAWLLIRRRDVLGWAAMGSIVCMALAGITQNAFQDSAVRFHWAALEGLLIWAAARATLVKEISDGLPFGRGQRAVRRHP